MISLQLKLRAKTLTPTMSILFIVGSRCRVEATKQLGEELGKRDGTRRDEGGRGWEDPLEGSVENACRADGVDLKRMFRYNTIEKKDSNIPHLDWVPSTGSC